MLAIEPQLFANIARGLVVAGYRPGISRRPKNDVISLIGGIIDGGENVLTFQRGIIAQDFLKEAPDPRNREHR